MRVENTFVKPSPIHGVGLFAMHNIKCGEEIIHGWVDMNKNIDEWIQYNKTEKHRSFSLLTGGCCINHSDYPNSNREKYPRVFATTDIKEGEEITEDYNLLPDEDNPFKQTPLIKALYELATMR